MGASRWSLPDGQASATVRIDCDHCKVCNLGGRHYKGEPKPPADRNAAHCTACMDTRYARVRELYVGVVTSDYWGWDRLVFQTPERHAWGYSDHGDLCSGSSIPWSHEGLRLGGVRLRARSVMKVSLANRLVTFSVDGAEQCSFPLPEGCGDIALGVSLTKDAIVTLLR